MFPGKVFFVFCFLFSPESSNLLQLQGGNWNAIALRVVLQLGNIDGLNLRTFPMKPSFLIEAAAGKSPSAPCETGVCGAR